MLHIASRTLTYCGKDMERFTENLTMVNLKKTFSGKSSARNMNILKNLSNRKDIVIFLIVHEKSMPNYSTKLTSEKF